MKTRVIKSILVLLLVFVAMPMMAQDYMEVNFKDGNKHKFCMPYVNKIFVSKYDAEGNLHNDYLYQHVITNTNTYVYELADIDYISYTDCDEEVVEQNIVSSLETVLPFLDECQTISDVEERIESIKNADSIEDAWSDGSQLCIKIKDWGVMSFHFHAEEQTDEAKEEQWETELMRKISSAFIHKVAAGTSPLKVAIANQTKNNDMPVWYNVRKRLDKISYLFKSCGITPVTVEPSIDFFTSEMYDYDVVVLCTHGGVMTKENGGLWFDQNGDNEHFLFTSDNLGSISKFYFSTSEPSEDKLLAATNTLKNLLDRKGLMDYLYKDDIRVDWIEELRGAVDCWVAYPLVTENFIIDASEGKEFQNPNSLIFAAVCHSLEGTHSLARKLQDRKNLNGYIGFDGEVSASVGSNAALYYFMSLLAGNSMGKSEALIPDDYKFDTSWRKNTSLVSSYRNEDSFLFPTFTNQVDQTVAQNAFNSSGYVEVEGSTTLSDPDADNTVSMGFMYGTDEDLSSATYISNVVITKLTKPLDNGHGNVVFRGQLTGLQPGKTYYYRAYTYDGMNYNFNGETCMFTIAQAVKKLIKVEPTEIDFGEVEVGSSKSATFTVSNVGTASLTVTVASGLDEGDDCVFPGSGQQFTLAVGQSKTFTVTFTPTKENSGFNAIVRILSDAENDTQIVTISGRSYKAADIPSYTSCPDDNHPHLIDLGIRGVLWSCCNVGASKPEEYGSYYAWGETEEKAVYSWNTYIHCEGNYDSCHDIGSEIAGTDYDVAHVKWGEPWIMPNHMDFESLIVLCKHEYITVNGVSGCKFTGTNGGSIFFPAAGYRQGSSLNEDYYNKPWGEYWSSTLKGPNRLAYDFYFCFNGWCSSGEGSRSTGFPVRPIVKK